MPSDDNDPDVVVIPPRSLAAIIILSAVVGGVVGYLVCNFFEGKPPEDENRELGQIVQSGPVEEALRRSSIS